MDAYGKTDLNEMLSAVRSHDGNAFSELVLRYTPLLNKLVGRFVSNTVNYGEAFSEACLALHSAALSYDVAKADTVTFGLYASICVRRRLSDLADKCGRAARESTVDVELISADGDAEQSMVRQERVAEYMQKARTILSEYEYRVLVLYVDGYTTAEIAKELGRDRKSVENAKSRMLKHLRSASNALFDF